MLVDHSHGADLPHADYKSIFTCPLQQSSGSMNQDVIDGEFFLLNGIDSTGTISNSTGMATARQFPWAATYVFNSKLTDSIANATNEPPHFKMSAIKQGAETVVMTEKITSYGEYLDPVVQSYLNGNSRKSLSVRCRSRI